MKRSAAVGIEVVPAEFNVDSSDANFLAEVGVRSQRLSDAYPVRQRIHEPGLLVHRVYSKATSSVINALVNFLFPRVLHHSGLIGALFARTTAVRLLCPHTCSDGHICVQFEGHRGDHYCCFGHRNKDAIYHCGHTCDCRGCEADCAFRPGHGGPHKCTFNHSWSDVPGSRSDIVRFRLDKAIGDYVDELAYATPEEIRYAHIPETLNATDENWTAMDDQEHSLGSSTKAAEEAQRESVGDNDDEIAFLRRLLNDLEVSQGTSPMDV